MSFYFTPDLSAGSFRAASLIPALQALLPEGSHIDVLTTMPNRYSSFSAMALEAEEIKGLSIRRFLLPSHRSGMRDQSRAFLAYARGVRSYVRHRKYDLVFATSSRLMTAVLGASEARRLKAPLYLDIRDIFVDTIQDILPRGLAWPMGAAFSLLERFAIGTANRVNLVSRGFEQYFMRRYPKQRFSFFSNGIDDEFLPSEGDKPLVNQAVSRPYSVLYAGNLGEGQGLHLVLPGLARVLRGQVRFIIIGDGGRKQALKDALDATGVDNVSLLDPVSRSELLQAYKQADVLFLHLNDYDAFRKVLPSKLFEYGATGKPILAGVGGYAASFVRDELNNAVVFPPCDAEAGANALLSLSLAWTDRKEFIERYTRTNIMGGMARDIMELVNEEA